MDERLVAVEEAMAAGEEVSLEPPLALVLGEDLHHPAIGGQVIVAGHAVSASHVRSVTSNTFCSRFDEVSSGPKRRKVDGLSVDDVAEERAEYPSRLAHDRPRAGYVDSVVTEVGQLEVGQQEAAVGVRVGAHSPLADRGEVADGLDRGTVLVEELFGPVAAEPRLELGQMLGVGADLGQGKLVGPERSLDW